MTGPTHDASASGLTKHIASRYRCPDYSYVIPLQTRKKTAIVSERAVRQFLIHSRTEKKRPPNLPLKDLVRQFRNRATVDCFASLAMTCNGLSMSSRGAQRRGNLRPGQSRNLRNAVLVSDSPRRGTCGRLMKNCVRPGRLRSTQEVGHYPECGFPFSPSGQARCSAPTIRGLCCMVSLPPSWADPVDRSDVFQHESVVTQDALASHCLDRPSGDTQAPGEPTPRGHSRRVSGTDGSCAYVRSPWIFPCLWQFACQPLLAEDISQSPPVAGIS